MKKLRCGLNCILLVLLSVVLVAATLFSALAFQKSATDSAQERAYRTLGDSAQEQAATFTATLNGQFAVLGALATVLSQDGLLTSGDLVPCLDAAIGATAFTDLMFADMAGGGVANGGKTANVADRRYFREAAAGGKVIERITGGRLDAKLSFDIAVPVRSSGEIVGVLAGVFDVQSFTELMISEAYSGRGSSFVTGADGVVVIGSRDSRYVADDDLLALLRKAEIETGGYGALQAGLSSGVPGVMLYSIGGERLYAVYQPLGINGWMLFNVVPDEAVDEEIRETVNDGYLYTGVLLLVSLIFVVLIILLTRSQSRALRREKEALEAVSERLRMALENTTVTTWDFDLQKRRIIQNPDSIARHGLGEVVENVPRSLVEAGYVHPDSVEAFLRMYDRLLSGERKVEGVFRVRRPDGSGYWYEHVRYTSLADAGGKPYLAVGVSEDVTEKYEAQLAYRRELTYRSAVGADICAWAVLNVTKRVPLEITADDEVETRAFENAGFTAYFRKCADMVAEDGEARDYYLTVTPEKFERDFANGEPSFSFDYLRRFMDGREAWVSYESHLLTDPDSGDLIIFVYLKDIDEEKHRMEKLTRAAEMDSMTGLYNHDAMLLHMERFLSGEGRTAQHAVFMVDLDNFKLINDSFGHQRGDAVLQETAEKIRRLFRSTDIVGRVGGDEFMVLMKNAADLALVGRRAEELVDTLRSGYELPDGGIELAASVGVAIYREGQAVRELYAQSDAALYAAKQSGKGRYVFYGNFCIIPGAPDAR